MAESRGGKPQGGRGGKVLVLEIEFVKIVVIFKIEHHQHLGFFVPA